MKQLKKKKTRPTVQQIKPTKKNEEKEQEKIIPFKLKNIACSSNYY